MLLSNIELRKTEYYEAVVSQFLIFEKDHPRGWSFLFKPKVRGLLTLLAATTLVNYIGDL
tara:strand:+ start:163 stop:342 length:180 start_codon:yes stop_codon:yes gene_type:complete